MNLKTTSTTTPLDKTSGKKITRTLVGAIVCIFVLVSAAFLVACETSSESPPNTPEDTSDGTKGGTGEGTNGGTNPISKNLKEILLSSSLSLDTDLSKLPPLYQDIFKNYAAAAPDSYITLNTIFFSENGAGKKDGSSWDNAKEGSTLKDTLDNLDPTTGSGIGAGSASATNIYILLLATGTYTPAAPLAMKDNVMIFGGWLENTDWKRSVFDLENTNSGSQTGSDGDSSLKTIISGSNTHQVFYNSGLSSSAVLSAVTISDGTGRSGGGMYNINSSPTLTEVSFINNNARLSGGAITNKNSSSPSITQARFINNVASSNSGFQFGGAIINTNKSSPTITHARFIGNTVGLGSRQGHGGAIFNEVLSILTLKDVIFSDNTSARSAGAIYNRYGGGAVTLIFTDVIFSNNTSGILGGAIYNIFYSHASFTNVTFSNNTAPDSGGAFVNDLDAGATFTNVSFFGNSSGNAGGGMFNRNSPITFKNVSFVNNSAAGIGGGLSNESPATLINTTFFNNTTGNTAGGIFHYGAGNSLTLINSIVWGNTRGSVKNNITIGTAGTTAQENVTIAYSILEGGTDSIIRFVGTTAPLKLITTGLARTGSGAFSLDPKLSLPTGSNTGFLVTHPIIAMDSSALGIGAFVQVQKTETATTYYYSEDNSTWYTNIGSTTGSDYGLIDSVSSVPADAIYLTSSSIDNPDAGAYAIP